MPKQGSIKHYRQTGDTQRPTELPFGELAVAKDGTLYVGNAADVPVQAGVQVYVHTYDAQAKCHSFTGGGENGRALVTAAVNAGDIFAVNGNALPAYTGADETDELPVGRWVSFTCDGTQLNFKAGGSGVDCKLIAAATAQALPPSAREKTLAVLTQTAINGYAFSPTSPASAAGRVWVKTLPVPPSGGNAFNLVKKAERAIEILVAGVYQYMNNAWEAKAAKLYLDGAWQDVTYSVTYEQGRAGTFAPQVNANLAHGALTPAFKDPVTSLPGFTFMGWSPAVAETVTETAAYSALFTQDQYVVRYLPGAQGAFEMQTYSKLIHGDVTPQFSGTPTSKSEEYEFADWSPSVSLTVRGNEDYTAQWAWRRTFLVNGGWNAGIRTSGNQYGDRSVVNSGGLLFSSGSTGSAGCFVFNSLCNLSNYRYLVIYIASAWGAALNSRVGVFGSAPSWDTPVMAGLQGSSGSFGAGAHWIDISNFNGSYYVGFTVATGNGSFMVSKMWLEV